MNLEVANVMYHKHVDVATSPWRWIGVKVEAFSIVCHTFSPFQRGSAEDEDADAAGQKTVTYVSRI